MKRIALLTLVLCACSQPRAPQPRHPAQPIVEAVPTLKLPSDTHALRERLELSIDPDADGFSGAAEIEVRLDKPRSVVWMHARDLTITAVKVNGATARWEQADPSGVARIVLPAPVSGPLRITIAWRATWSDGPTGLYRSKQSGKQYALTQLEPVDARRVFPCFDEPSAKIPWEVALTVPKGLVAIANGNETSRVEHEQNVRIEFAPTPPLPSYLVAFAVGPFDIVNAAPVPPSAVRPRPLPLRLIVPKGRANDASYAAAHTGDLVTGLERYFGIAYPYEKLDLITSPDLGGAMENAGALMFNESILLFDPSTSSIAQRRRFASVVAHELAHQWFGDLVTMAWWDDLWLNESFATWMGDKITEEWDPQMEGALELSLAADGAMEADGQLAARAMRQPIRTNDDITNAFDDITYDKGGAVLRMFERFIGAERFQKGVHEYLQAHRFGCATVTDFTSALTAVAGRDIDTPMRTFLDAPGVPIVESKIVCAGAPHLHVKQSRYFPSTSTASTATPWKIPFCARYEANGKSQEACALLEVAEADIPFDGGVCPAWVMPNARGAGYYRIALDKEQLEKLRGKPFAQLDTAERLAYGLALSSAESHGTLPYAELVTDSLPLLDDPHAALAETPIGFLGEARDWLIGTPLQPKIERKIRDTLRPLAVKLGDARKPGEDPDRSELRSQVLSTLYFSGRDEKVRNAFAPKGAACVAGGKLHRDAIAPELMGLALYAYVDRDGAPAWNAILALLANEQDAAMRRLLLRALAASADPALREKTLALTFDASLRAQEVLSPIWRQLERPELRDAAWVWVKTHYDAIAKRVSGDMFGGLRLINLGSAFCDDAHAADVEKFFAPRLAKLAGGPRALAEQLESTRTCAARRAREEKEMRAYFE